MPEENEATTILEIKVNDVTYDRLCRTAQAFGEKATVEDVIQAMIQGHLKGGAPSPFFSGRHDCPDKLEPSTIKTKGAEFLSWLQDIHRWKRDNPEKRRSK